jgi:hypothetical protein
MLAVFIRLLIHIFIADIRYFALRTYLNDLCIYCIEEVAEDVGVAVAL